MKRRQVLALAATAVSAPAFAQNWPARPITFVVPTSPGGLIDSVARGMADEMGKRLGQPIVIENKVGASGMLATQAVARAAPDGYTILVGNSTPIINAPFMFKKVPYDAMRDLSFISQICAGQLLFTVNSEMVPATNMKEFIAWAKKNKGKVAYGSYGQGTTGHLLGAALSTSQDLDMTHIPYKGEAPMLQDLLAGRFAWAITSASSAGPHIKGGKVRALGIIGDRRVAVLPDVPTMAEAGLPEPEYKIGGWIGLLAPTGTPAPILERLEKEARTAAQTTVMKARFQVAAMAPIGSTSAEFRRDVEASIPLHERLIRSAGVEPQ